MLTRHWRLSNHNEEPLELTSTSEHEGVEPCNSTTIPTHEIRSNQPNTVIGAGGSELQHEQVPLLQQQLTDPVAHLDDIQTQIISQNLQHDHSQNLDYSAPQNLQHENYQDDNLDDFRDFVNFIDGVGLSAQWTPEYDIDWMRLDNYNQESRQPSRHHSRGPISPQSPGPEDIGTPFSTWLPSAPRDDQIYVRSQSGHEVREKRGNNGTYHVTEDHRTVLQSLLSSFPEPICSFVIPSRHALTRYTTAFFSGFHSHFPFIHEPTYKPSCSPIELTLAMCAAGAQYCFEKRSSERLFRVSKAIVFERLRQEEAHFGPQTLAFIASTNMLSPAIAVSTRSGPWEPLDMAKTLLILVGIATWERKDLLQQAFALRTLLVQCLRDSGLKEDDAATNITAPRSAVWDQWVQRESARRTKLVAYCYINVHSIAYNIHPLLWSSEMHLRLPCCTPEWQATTAAQWAALQREGKESQMHFQQALSLLLQGTAGGESVHPIPSPIGNYILLHALLQRIHVVRELSIPATSPATIPPLELHTIW